MIRKSKTRGAIAGSLVGGTIGLVLCFVAPKFALISVLPCVLPVLRITEAGRDPLMNHGLIIVVGVYAFLGALIGALIGTRGRKPKPGYCLKCGYDLTGNESGKCPECGEAIDADV